MVLTILAAAFTLPMVVLGGIGIGDNSRPYRFRDWSAEELGNSYNYTILIY